MCVIVCMYLYIYMWYIYIYDIYIYDNICVCVYTETLEERRLQPRHVWCNPVVSHCLETLATIQRFSLRNSSLLGCVSTPNGCTAPLRNRESWPRARLSPRNQRESLHWNSWNHIIGFAYAGAIESNTYFPVDSQMVHYSNYRGKNLPSTVPGPWWWSLSLQWETPPPWSCRCSSRGESMIAIDSLYGLLENPPFLGDVHGFSWFFDAHVAHVVQGFPSHVWFPEGLCWTMLVIHPDLSRPSKTKQLKLPSPGSSTTPFRPGGFNILAGGYYQHNNGTNVSRRT